MNYAYTSIDDIGSCSITSRANNRQTCELCMYYAFLLAFDIGSFSMFSYTSPTKFVSPFDINHRSIKVYKGNDHSYLTTFLIETILIPCFYSIVWLPKKCL
jgi:hypothetical protein